jgi:predicted ester cyclase
LVAGGGDRRLAGVAWVVRAGKTLEIEPGLGTIVDGDRMEGAVAREDAWKLADHWIAAWNAHDLDLILAHYEDAVELTSPAAAQLLATADGKVIGKANLRAYFQRGLEAYPQLHFQLEDVLWGVNSVVLYYKNQKGTSTAEFMELSANGKVARVVANYSA